MLKPEWFTSDALMARASAQSGLTNFGHPHFKAGLENFIDACCNDGFVAASGLPVIADAITKILVNRLRFEQALSHHPEILDEVIVKPLIIIGAPARVGSTKLHRLLANAENIQTFPLWQVLNPIPLPDAQPDQPDPRIKITEDFCAQIETYQPQLYAAIQPVAREPDEDPYMMDMSFMQLMFNTLAHVPSYVEWIYRQDWRDAYSYHKKLLQYLQWQNGTAGKPMLLKGPSVTGHIDLLHALLPDAKFVQIHRDPVTCLASIAKVVNLFHKIQPTPGLATVQDSAKILAFYTRHLLLENLAVRSKNPDIPIIDFYYEDVRHHALHLADRIFEFWGVPLTPASRDRIAAWEQANSQHKLGKFEYTLEEAGIDRAAFEASIKPYMTRFYPDND